jgi:hypothetical protein
MSMELELEQQEPYVLDDVIGRSTPSAGPKVTIGVFRTHQEASDAMKELEATGFALANVSVVTRDPPTEDPGFGGFDPGAPWDLAGPYRSWVRGMMVASASFLLGSVGLVVIAGPLVRFLSDLPLPEVGAPNRFALALSALGVDPADVSRYEAALRADRFLLVVQGDPDQLAHAREVLAADEITLVTGYPAPPRPH